MHASPVRLRLRGLRACSLIAALLATPLRCASAETAPPFADLLLQVQNAPRLAEASAQVRRAEGLALQAGARPNPSLGVTSENIAGSSAYSGFRRAEVTLNYSQPIELGGKRSARLAAGTAGVSAAQARNREGRIAYAFDLARAYGLAETSVRRLALIDEEIDNAVNDLRATRALVDAGKEANLRALQAEAALTVLRADRESAGAARAAAFSRLTALASAPRAYDALADSLLELPPLSSASLDVDPQQSASYLAAVAEREAAQKRITVEQRRAIPDLTASVGVRRLEGDNANALVVGLSIPLTIFDRNRGNIDASVADLQASEARLDMARNEAEAEGRVAQSQLAAAETGLSAALVAERTGEETYRLARIAYEGGKSPLSEVLIARRGLGAARSAVLNARSARFEARAQLSRLQGRTILGGPVP